MSYTIVFSGPQGKLQQARKALDAAGCRVHLDEGGAPLPHNWGHPDSHETEWSGERDENGDVIWGTGQLVPKTVRHPISFMTVEGVDIDKAHFAVEPLGWRLRTHWNNDQDVSLTPPGFGEVTGELLAEVAALRMEINSLKATK